MMHKRLVWMLLTLLPSALAQSPVLLHPPGSYVDTLGRKMITLTCVLESSRRDTLVNVTWLFNGSSLESLGLDDIITDFSEGIGVLIFTNLVPEYNRTTIRCHGSLLSDRDFLSNPFDLLLQDTLAAVGDLNITSLNSTIFLTWTAPFTLNLSNILVDITYTVSVVSPASLHMMDGVTMTEFTYPLPPDTGCDNLVFTVTPMNGAGEGISNSISFSQAVKSPLLVEILQLTGTRTEGVRIYHLLMSSPVCSAEITLTDKNTGEVITLGDMDLNISSTITRTSVKFRLALNRQYEFTVNASNTNGSEISSGNISTYDVVSSEIRTNPLRIHTEYLPNSNAAGVLYSFLLVGENGTDFTESVYLVLSGNDSLRYELPSPIPAGAYQVHAYVIQQDGLLSSGENFPATSQIFSGTGGSQVPISTPSNPSEVDCNIELSGHGPTVSVMCTRLPTSSITGFMLVAQEKNVDGGRRLLVNSTEQEEPQGPVTVQVTVGGAYQVTVFPIREGMGILESNVAYTEEIVVDIAVHSTDNTPTPTVFSLLSAGTTTPSSSLDMLPIIIGAGVGLGVLALLAVILGAVILVVACRRSRGSLQEISSEGKAEAHVEKSGKVEPIGLAAVSPLVYEEIGDVKSSFTYTQNVLYGVSSTGATRRLTSDPVPEVPIATGIEPHDRCVEIHNYELIQTAEYQSIDDAYKLKQCSAYGVASSSHDTTRSRDLSSRSHDLILKSRDLDREVSKFPPGHSGIAVGELDDPENSGLSETSCDLEECPAYGVPPL